MASSPKNEAKITNPGVLKSLKHLKKYVKSKSFSGSGFGAPPSIPSSPGLLYKKKGGNSPQLYNRTRTCLGALPEESKTKFLSKIVSKTNQIQKIGRLSIAPHSDINNSFPTVIKQNQLINKDIIVPQESHLRNLSPICSPMNRRARASEKNSKLKLERVLGLTVTSSASLSCECNGTIAYPAGCTIVLYSPHLNKQSHIVNPSKKTITCLTFSADGKYLATGESGHDPAVRVWNVEEKVQVEELLGHKYAISCVAFDPKGKYLVSVGEQHDQLVCVWDWKRATKQASNKISSKVQAVCFAESGQYFVTVGHRSVKYWYLERSRVSPMPKYGNDVAVIKGRSAILGDHRYNMFMDVVCGKGALADRTYCVTQKGVLCEFDSRRMLDKWVDLQTKCANSLTWGSGNLFVGCAEGKVRVFVADGFKFITQLPPPHHLGVDVAKGQSPEALTDQPSNAVYPDTVAVSYSETVKRVTCVYDDHSIYQWEVKNLDKMGLVASHMYHSGCLWGVECYPLLPSDSTNPHPILTPNTFMTCGNDHTIRVWNCDEKQDVCYSDTEPGLYARNIFSKEMVKVIYLGKDLNSLRDNDAKNSDKIDVQYDGVRCLKVSPDGQHLASGDRTGNVRVHDLNTLQLVTKTIEAHDSEVVCLEYSRFENGPYFLASGSRDRNLHVFDAANQYQLFDTIDDHTAAITAVKFVEENDSMHMLSCGADKTIVYRDLQTEPELTFLRNNQVAAPTTIYDMQIDPVHKCALTACQDRQIRMYDLSQGKYKESLKGALGEDGNLIKLQVDPSCQFIATSCTDKTVCLIDLKNGEIVAAVSGHSEVVTGIAFTPDCSRLITVSFDGCVFVWRLSEELSRCMIRNLPQNYLIPQEIHIGVNEIASEPEMVENVDYVDNNTATNQLFDRQNFPLKEKPPKSRKLWSVPVSTPLSLMNPTNMEEQMECFLGPGSVSSIRQKFETDSLGKSPVSCIRSSRGMADGSSDPASPPGNSGSSPVFPHIPTNPAISVDSPQSILFVDSPNYDTGNFEVKERTEMLKNSQPRYARADTLGNDFSDEEESSNMSASPSFQNLRGGLNQSMEVLNTRKHWEIKDAFDSIARVSPEKNGEALSRGNPARRSLTQKALNSSTPETRARWGPPPSIPSPIMYSTPIINNSFKFNDRTHRISQNSAGPTWSPDKVESRGRLNSQGRLNPNRKSLIEEASFNSNVSVQMRIRNNVPRDKNRRLTLPTHMFLPMDDEYGSSDLHLRSKSPGQYHSPLKRRDSNSSDVSFASNTSRMRVAPFGGVVGGASRPGTSMEEARGIQSSLSMSALHHASTSSPTTNVINSQTNRRLSDIREKLRKSHENLALSPEAAEVLNSDSALSGLSRSKSYGALNNPEDAPKPVSRTGMGYLEMAKSRTKSVGCLREEEGGMKSARSLADSIRDLKNISNSDIDKTGLESRDKSEDLGTPDSSSFYERSSTMPRQRPKGAVLKKIETRQRYIDRASASGDSDSASDANSSRYSAKGRNMPNYARRLNNTIEAEIKEVYGSPYKPVNNTSFSSNAKPALPAQKPGRGTNYLAHKLLTGPDTEQGPELINGNASVSSYGDSASADKMSRHSSDCLSELQASVDKIVQAFELVRDERDLSEADRQNLLSRLESGMQAATRKLDNQRLQQNNISQNTVPRDSQSTVLQQPNIPPQMMQQIQSLIQNCMMQQEKQN